MSVRTAGLRRYGQLLAGLVLMGMSIALMVRADIGLPPWDVLHQGLARLTGISMGTMVIVVSVLVLVLWIPLRQRPGMGTLLNVVLVGLSVDLTLVVVRQPEAIAWQLVLLGAGILSSGVATGLYIGAGMGAGPRDGLMTGLAERGLSLRTARTGIELIVLLAGWLLGGTVGVGTLVFAVTIGPLSHVFIPLLGRGERHRTGPDARPPRAGTSE